MSVLNIVEIEAITFILVLARMSAFLVTWPVLGSVNVPANVKVLLSLLLSLVIFPTIPKSAYMVISNWQELMFYTLKEVAIGLVLAYVSTFFFYIVSVAGDLVGISMGISSAKIFNPTLSSSMTPIDQFYYVFAVILFLALNFHHVFLTGLVHSYDIVPVNTWSFDMSSFAEVALFGRRILIVGLQLAAPVLVSILLINITLAIIGRAVPQINVLITSLPMNILAGLLVLMVSVPFLLSFMGENLHTFADMFFSFLKTV